MCGDGKNLISFRKTLIIMGMYITCSIRIPLLHEICVWKSLKCQTENIHYLCNCFSNFEFVCGSVGYSSQILFKRNSYISLIRLFVLQGSSTMLVNCKGAVKINPKIMIATCEGKSCDNYSFKICYAEKEWVRSYLFIIVTRSTFAFVFAIVFACLVYF